MKCQKLKLSDNTVLLGITISRDEYTLTFRTRKQDHIISLSQILRLTDTNEEFKEETK